MFGRKKVAVVVAEFLGTALLTLVVLSVQRSTIGIPYFIALAAGLAVALMVMLFGASSGAFLNPALTLAMWTTRRLKTVNAIVYIVAQFLGAWAAFGLYTYFVHTHIQEASSSEFNGRVLVAEALGTFVLAFGWAAASFRGLLGGYRAAATGLAYTIGVVVASGAGLALINPAVALGVNAWVWGTYVLGPVLGAIIGANLYTLLFAPAEGVAVAAAFTRRRTTTAPAAVSTTRAAKPAARTTAKRKPAAKKRPTRR